MNKLLKVLVGVVVVVVVLLLAAILTLPLTIGPIVRTAASVGGPKALGVPVSVGDVKLRPFAGDLIISKVTVGNPKGYSDKDAFAVDNIEIGLKMSSLIGDTLVIRKIQIDAPQISFESKGGKSNFDTMMANAKKASEAEKQKKPGGTKEGKKVVIEEFTLNNAKVAFASGLTRGKALIIPVPSVTVRDIGKRSGGASAAEALTEVLNGILGGLSQAVTGAAGDLLKGAGGAAGDLLKGAGGVAGDVAKGATEALKGVTGGAQDAASGAVGVAEDAAKGATKALKDVAGGAQDAVSGAVDTVKKLNPFAK